MRMCVRPPAALENVEADLVSDLLDHLDRDAGRVLELSIRPLPEFQDDLLAGWLLTVSSEPIEFIFIMEAANENP